MKAKYKVTGSQAVLGHAPGETFSADLPAGQEERLVGRGQLTVLKKSSKSSEPTKKRSWLSLEGQSGLDEAQSGTTEPSGEPRERSK